MVVIGGLEPPTPAL